MCGVFGNCSLRTAMIVFVEYIRNNAIAHGLENLKTHSANNPVWDLRLRWYITVG